MASRSNRPPATNIFVSGHKTKEAQIFLFEATASSGERDAFLEGD